jgi:uncharacterized ParB-like nuclease family protein
MIMKPIEIALEKIDLAIAYMPRFVIDWSVVNEYEECIDDLPPILVAIGTGAKPYVLIDGWHRFHAHEQAEHKTIMAFFDKKLKPEDFFFAAARSNKAHGIRFTANEKKKISQRLFMKENRSAAEISEAIGCSVRHASDLIQELAHEKKAQAIKYARQQANDYSVREIAEQLKGMGFKASKSSVSRWIQPAAEEPEEVVPHTKEESQIGEVPEEDKWSEVEEEPVDRPVMNVSGEVASISKMIEVKAPTRIGVCPRCKIRTVRVPSHIPGSCTELFFYCDRCEEYVSIRILLPKADDAK